MNIPETFGQYAQKMSDVLLLPHCCNITIELLSLLESCAPSCDAKVSEPEIKDLKQTPCITVSPDNCQDPSHKILPEGHGQVELHVIPHS